MKTYDEMYDRRKTGRNRFCALFLFLLLAGCGVQDQAWELPVKSAEDPAAQPAGSVEETASHPETEVADALLQDVELPKVYVHVCGEVVSPGVYCLPADARVADALEMAGGFTQRACTSRINLAETLKDGTQIYFPSEEEAEALSQESASEQSGLVNINTAGEEALCTLSGIGPGRAKDIIAYRESHGGFGSIEEIMQVPGIKEAVFQKIQEQITVK